MSGQDPFPPLPVIVGAVVVSAGLWWLIVWGVLTLWDRVGA